MLSLFFADRRVWRAAVDGQCLTKRSFPLGAPAPPDSDLKQPRRSSPKRYRSGFASSNDAFDLPKQLLPGVIDFLRPVATKQLTQGLLDHAEERCEQVA